MAEACKRLIKNCIICWNALYLSQKLAEIDDPAKREELLQEMAHGSPIWSANSTAYRFIVKRFLVSQGMEKAC